ncbi:MAG: L-histidine N(alpha)-methyltransferase [Candidatus Nitronauta litoralis]|uniref:L-histidine N(Alpha)-methyltransferase n=1 Tax=Candidatus Nitronauta litoralis TaxID=2705533 RepID=A0A7T0BX78_9BACT|nr:MAG: L-histidine N(alpha)-methyltransferase [Candidatus Nitronauta litoralis]
MSFEIIDLSFDKNSPTNEISFAATVLEGLSKPEKQLPSWLIFDDKGSEIFSEIVKLENYHPAICEKNIIHTNRNIITDIVEANPLQLIELGAGDGEKTLPLIEHILNIDRRLHYIPIDISPGAIKNLVSRLKADQKDPSLKVTGVIGDYFDGLTKFSKNKAQTSLVLYLGLTLGNQDLSEAGIFLKRVSETLNRGDFMLTGFDLFSNPKLHYQIYNDPQGLFEKFNLHLLERINQELGGNFQIENFAQEGHYNWRTRSVESYVYSLKDQTVKIEALDKEFFFKQGEGLQTEQSYKFTLDEIKQLAEDNGFEIVKNLFETNNKFVNTIWRVL